MNKPNHRQNNNNSMKRGRNQRRRQGGGNNPNRALDSNGPDVRIRGTANQIYDKYQGLARDAASSGDRVRAENYLQHAEHYFRLIKATQPTPAPVQPSEAVDADGEQPSIEEEKSKPESRANGADQDKTVDKTAKEKPSEAVEAEAGGEEAVEEKKPRKRRARKSVKKDDETDVAEAPEKAAAS